jgi:hypothetical protein
MVSSTPVTRGVIDQFACREVAIPLKHWAILLAASTASMGPRKREREVEIPIASSITIIAIGRE